MSLNVHTVKRNEFECLFKGRIVPLPDESNPYLQKSFNVIK